MPGVVWVVRRAYINADIDGLPFQILPVTFQKSEGKLHEGRSAKTSPDFQQVGSGYGVQQDAMSCDGAAFFNTKATLFMHGSRFCAICRRTICECVTLY